MLYLSSSCKKEMSLSKFIKKTYKNGIRNIELSGGEYSNIKLKKILYFYKQKKCCRFIVHNYFPPPKESFILNIASINENYRKRSVDFAKKAILLSKEIGSKFYAMHAGYCKNLIISEDGEYFQPDGLGIIKKEDALIQMEKSIKELCIFSKKLNMGFGIENLFPPKDGENFSLLCSYDEIHYIIEKFKIHQNFGILLDLGHAKISGNVLGFNPEEFAKQIAYNFKNRLLGVHLSENNGFIDQHLLPSLNSWMIEFIKKVKGSNLPITIEARNSHLDKVILFYNFISERIKV